MFTNWMMDAYDRNARLYPALLVAAPVAVVVAAYSVPRLETVETVVSVLVAGGLTYLFCQIARDAGDGIQDTLFKLWDGMPSVAILRHADSRIDPITKLRYHKRLAALVSDTTAPTETQEKKDLAKADATYVAWSAFLRVTTRDSHKFPLITVENINFGYRKNLLGMRGWGRWFSSVSLVAAVVMTGNDIYADHWHDLDGFITFALTLDVAFWALIVKPAWVKQAGDAYAARLVEAVELLGK